MYLHPESMVGRMSLQEGEETPKALPTDSIYRYAYSDAGFRTAGVVFDEAIERYYAVWSFDGGPYICLTMFKGPAFRQAHLDRDAGLLLRASGPDDEPALPRRRGQHRTGADAVPQVGLVVRGRRDRAALDRWKRADPSRAQRGQQLGEDG